MEGRFSDLLLVRSTAAVNACLTGSVDRVSPWQRRVDVDRSQKNTHKQFNLVGHNHVRYMLSVSQRKEEKKKEKIGCTQNGM